MKRSILMIIAALTFAAVLFSGCVNASSGIKPGAKVTVKPTAQIADGSGYENITVFENGAVKRGDFNWRFFLSKVSAGMNANVTIRHTESGKDYKISFANGAFSVDDGDTITVFKHLVTYSRELPETSAFSQVEIGILTNDPGMTPEKFFGGDVPDGVSIGLKGTESVLVFAAYKAK